MASIVVTRRGAGLVVRTTTDRVLLREFLERDRLFAAYAICDLDDREFSRTRWGGAFVGTELVARRPRVRRPVAPAAVRDGPQRRDRGGPARPGQAPRAAYVAALPEAMPAVETSYRVEPGPQMVRMWVDRTTFRPYPADTPRLLPVEVGELNRLYQLGFASWLGSSAIADGRLLRRPGQRPPRRRGRDPRHQPDGPAGGRRQRPDPGRVPRPRLRHGDDRGGDRRAAAVLRPGRPQRPGRQPAGAAGLSAARLPGARPLRGAPRPSARFALAQPARPLRRFLSPRKETDL